MNDSKEDEITDLLLEDIEENTRTIATNKKRKYVSWLPRLYWLFYRKPKYFLVFLPAFFSGFLMVISHSTLGLVLDSLSTPDPMKLIKKYICYQLMTSLFCAICNFLNYYYFVYIGSLIVTKLRSMLFKSLMKKKISFYDTHSIGELMTLLNNDCRYVERSFVSMKTHTIKALGKLTSALLLTFYIDTRFTIMTFIASVIAIVIQRSTRKIARVHTKMQSKADARAYTVADEAITNIRVVNSFNQQEEEVQRFEYELSDSSFHDSMGQLSYSLGSSVSSFLEWGIIGLVLNIGSFYVIKLKMTAGSLFILSKASMTFGDEINHFMGTIHMAQKGIDAANRVFDIIDDDQEEKGRRLNDFQGNIEFKDVWFKYPTRDQYVLKGISFKIKEGSYVAFVGHSGSGKSTIVQLLLRFYEVTEGMILLDDVDINELDPKWLHQIIGTVQQDSVLFSISVADNIKYGNPAASEESIHWAAEISNSTNFINELPDKYDTYVGSKAAALSGGQKQRIAIARAILSNPIIFLADEATSALDSENESYVQNALENVMDGRTTISIAHRLSTIKNANHIFVIESGEIVEEGNHETLIDKGGIYYNLYTIQKEHNSTEDLLLE